MLNAIAAAPPRPDPREPTLGGDAIGLAVLLLAIVAVTVGLAPRPHRVRNAAIAVPVLITLAMIAVVLWWRF